MFEEGDILAVKKRNDMGKHALVIVCSANDESVYFRTLDENAGGIWNNTEFELVCSKKKGFPYNGQ